MAVQNRVRAIPLTSIDSATFTGALQAINAGLPEACYLIRIINDSNRDVTISYDGVNDHDFIPQDGALQLPHQSNSQPSNYVALVPRGTIVYVSGLAGGTGLVYLAGYFQPNI